MTIKLYELLGDSDRRYSQFSWRAKMALKHKGLEFEPLPLLLTDKETIAFADAKSVPVMVDGEIIKVGPGTSHFILMRLIQINRAYWVVR